MAQEKYVVDVVSSPEGLKPSKQALESLKGALSKKMLSLMENEAVECPVFKETVPFLNCMACPNFIRRFKGKVFCKGDEIARPWGSRS
ncbi:MAG: hypothetical protein ACP5T2_03320 [Thermoprotei archaeon]